MSVAQFLLAVLLLNVFLLGLYLQCHEHQVGALTSPKFQAALSATLSQTLFEVTERLSSSSIVTFTGDGNGSSDASCLAPGTTVTSAETNSTSASTKCSPLDLGDNEHNEESQYSLSENEEEQDSETF
jgi:hypothetical protein